MAEISAAAVRAFREKTGLPLMDCKRALTEANGDEEKAIEMLRKAGEKLEAKRADRATEFGRFGHLLRAGQATGRDGRAEVRERPGDAERGVHPAGQRPGPATGHRSGRGDGGRTAGAAFAQQAGTHPRRSRRRDLFNRIREVFNVGRMVRIDGPCGGYSHNAKTVAGVLLAVDGGTDEVAKDICMHIAAMRPTALNVADLDPAGGRQGTRDSARSGPEGRQTGEHRRQDGRRSPAELLCRKSAVRAAVRQGRQADGRQVSPRSTR